ncbi:hypothetical protein EVAR_76557_1 [Eumeta japonica]|uniref:Integrase catalytic domain-containing protein n=1 Tax=Eumeta variegata TaxID=151549 RepID=A0A4C1T7M9_EUMVA|nr:hypothetical protein EVAR_76557_1 [Eumeta japonica]
MSIFDPLGLLCPVTIKGHQDRAPRIRRRERTRVRGRRLLARGTTRRHGTSRARRRQVTSCTKQSHVDPAARTASGAFGLSPSDEYPKEHGIATERRVLWCDSKTVLRWIRSDPRAYKPFVAHRLAELDERSDRNEWRWVNSADNPRTTRRARTAIWSVCTTHTGDVIDVTRFSSWTRLVRTYARVLYFIRRLRKQQQPFGADDVIDAETRLLRASQRRAFSDEMRAAAVGAATPEAVYGRWTPTVKKVANACRLCRVRRAQPVTPKMADLPGGRLAFRQRPFTHTGVDYFGPLEVTVGRRREKRWAALFTCLTTRAVHMEVASSLSADSMIMALRRFMARRGQPDTLYSDHGTNFVGAAAELSRARLEIEERMSDEATTRAIRWLRIPPRPHMGGSWERLVRSIKVALSATLHTRAPKDEVLHTLLLEAEFVVNSRPLTHISVLPSDPRR